MACSQREKTTTLSYPVNRTKQQVLLRSGRVHQILRGGRVLRNIVFRTSVTKTDFKTGGSIYRSRQLARRVDSGGVACLRL